MEKNIYVLTACGLTLLALSNPTPAPAAATLVGWNNLGMHCMDSDYSVFSILPPYNTIEAQLILNGKLVTSPGYTVTYQEVADPAGSINSSSVGKGNFYTYVGTIYGANPAPDMGLAGWAMPGTANQPRPMTFETVNSSASVNWYRAEGIPLTPYDDSGHKNTYPMMRLVARDGTNVLASTLIVLPVSDEMSCRACHASGSAPAARPAAGWVANSNPERDYRLNILRLHDEKRDPAMWTNMLAQNGLNPQGLYAGVVNNNQPVLCAKCHASVALAAPGVAGVPPLTQSMHAFHGQVMDPSLGIPMDSSHNRAACYQCHPGSTTRCLRGVMGAAVAADGTLAIQCQSCHGTMSQVGAATRTGWLMEPACGSCHTGTAAQNNGQIRYTTVFEPDGSVRVPADQTFATNPDTPAPGLSLYRFSSGHGGLQCEACHGSTHAEFPSTHLNDNMQSAKLQGHAGVLADCAPCHGAVPATVTGGPHGLHPVGQTWVDQHVLMFESGDATPAQCQACHGLDFRGTVLSRAQGNRSLVADSEQGTAPVTFYRGAIIGCYSCHNGPSGEGINTSQPPQANAVSVRTGAGQAVAFALPASGANLLLRIMTQPAHGTIGINGKTATYLPAPGYVGADSFTYAAYDGAKNSSLASGAITVAVLPDKAAPKLTILSPADGTSVSGATVYISGTACDSGYGNHGIASVTVNGVLAGNCTAIATGEANWSSTVSLHPGQNKITIAAKDGANNVVTRALNIFCEWTGANLWTCYWQNSSGGLAAWYMSGTNCVKGSMLNPPVLGANWSVVGVADLNGDGRNDLLLQHTNGTLAVWFMQGTNCVHSSRFNPPRISPGWHIAAVADFNQDGKSDFLWQHTSGALGLWLMDGTNCIGMPAVEPAQLDAGYTVVGAADFNRDGHPDILCQEQSGSLAVWLMNGTQRFDTLDLSPVTTFNPAWKVMGATDNNGDGYVEILWEHTSGAVQFWRMDNTNCLQSSRLNPASVNPAWKIVGP